MNRIPVASRILPDYCNILQDTLLFGKVLLKALYTKDVFERCIWQRVMNSGMVIVTGIG
jgi:hypothetical protein